MGMTVTVHCNQPVIILQHHLAVGTHTKRADPVLKKTGIKDKFPFVKHRGQLSHYFRRKFHPYPDIHRVDPGLQPQPADSRTSHSAPSRPGARITKCARISSPEVVRTPVTRPFSTSNSPHFFPVRISTPCPVR